MYLFIIFLSLAFYSNENMINSLFDSTYTNINTSRLTNLDKKEYIISFRSKFADVGNIAKIFGGGGHKLASACSIPIKILNIQDLFFSQSLPRY